MKKKNKKPLLKTIGNLSKASIQIMTRLKRGYEQYSGDLNDKLVQYLNGPIVCLCFFYLDPLPNHAVVTSRFMHIHFSFEGH